MKTRTSKLKSSQSMTSQSMTLGAFLQPGARFAVGSIDFADRWGGYVVLAGMIVWSVSRFVPEELLWNMQAARSFSNWA